MKNLYETINKISWLLEVLDEGEREIEKITKPTYRRLDIVLATDFCLFEVSQEKSRSLLKVAMKKYRFLLKDGYININNIVKSFNPYIIRMLFFIDEGLTNLTHLKKQVQEGFPPELDAAIENLKAVKDYALEIIEELSKAT